MKRSEEIQVIVPAPTRVESWRRAYEIWSKEGRPLKLELKGKGNNWRLLELSTLGEWMNEDCRAGQIKRSA